MSSRLRDAKWHVRTFRYLLDTAYVGTTGTSDIARLKVTLTRKEHLIFPCVAPSLNGKPVLRHYSTCNCSNACSLLLSTASSCVNTLISPLPSLSFFSLTYRSTVCQDESAPSILLNLCSCVYRIHDFSLETLHFVIIISTWSSQRTHRMLQPESLPLVLCTGTGSQPQT